jgi:hypothetical protein
MKRDMDLARSILLEMEKYAEPDGWADIKIDGYSFEEVSYHIKLLWQAELIEAKDITDGSGFDWRAISLTWKGHEFLDAARNTSHWKEAKKIISEKGISITFDVLKVVLSEIIKSSLFLK